MIETHKEFTVTVINNNFYQAVDQILSQRLNGGQQTLRSNPELYHQKNLLWKITSN